MANKKISELTTASTPDGSELVEIVQGGVNKKTTAQDIANLAPPGGGVIVTSWKDPAYCATTANITLSGDQTIDGINTAGGIRVLVKNQSDFTQNGIYTSSSGAWSRSTDADTGAELAGAGIVVQDGTVNGNTTWIQTADGITIGVTGIEWAQIGTVLFDNKYIIDQAVPSTASGTITLNMNSQISRSFVGSATFSTAKAIALSNTTNSMFFNFFFEVTNVAAELTPPSDWLMASDDFDGTDWVPPSTGKYELGGSFDDTNNVWYVKIAGPFS